MTVIDDNYETVKSQHASFLDGTTPEWLNEITQGTGASVTYETKNGGRAVLDTGTSATGDNARLVTDTINFDGFDAVGIRIVFELANNATNLGNAVVALGFRGDAGNGDTLHHHPNQATSQAQHKIRRDSDGSTYADATRKYLGTEKVETEIVFDVEDGEIIHRYQDSFALRLTSNVPDTTQDSQGHLMMLTKDTASTCTMYVYEVELTYYRKNNW